VDSNQFDRTPPNNVVPYETTLGPHWVHVGSTLGPISQKESSNLKLLK